METNLELLFCDLETYSDTPINCGTHRYAEDAEVMLFAYALDNNPVKVWDVTSGTSMPTELQKALATPSILTVWHNGGMFDSVILQHTLGIDIPLVRLHDTMVQALAHGLPGSLGTLCDVLGINADKAKDKEGKALINLFCKPRPKNSKYRRATRLTHPEEWQRFIKYAGSDIEAMREVYRKVPKWNLSPTEVLLWQLDQHINRRGICMDIDLANSALSAVDQEQKRLAKRTQEMTDGDVQAATQRDAMLRHITTAFGVELPDMQKSTLERRIADPDIPSALRELLSIRLQASTTSTSKYKALMKSVSSDGRLRGTKQFCGASRTGRWAGRIFQPDNLPRPTLNQDTIDTGIEALKSNCADLLFDNIMELTSSALRGVIIAPNGKKLVVSDLSNIEGRMLAWLAGEDWKLKAFSEYDNGTGSDLYKLAYARAYGMNVDDVDKNQRQIGKVMELACLAPDTLVLTKRGYIKLINIQNDDLLWDGIAWVTHRGVINKGYKKTVNLDGVKMTPDHQVLTPSGWKPASHIVSNKSMRYRSLELASVNLPSSVRVKKQRTNNAEFLSNAHAMQFRTPYSYTILLGEKVPDVINALKRKLKRIVRNTIVMPMPWVTTRLEHDYSIDYQQPYPVATMLTTDCTETTGEEGYMYAPSGNKINVASLGMLKLSMDLVTPVWKWIASITTKVMNPVTSALLQRQIITETDEKLLNYKKESMNWSNVYDIVHAGPRNRFTIKTNSGHLIVHNCGYGGGVAAFVTFALTYALDLEELATAALPNIPVKVQRDAMSWYKKSVEQNQTYGLRERVFITCDSLKRMWRNAHIATVPFWYELEEAVKRAISSPNITIPCRKLRVRRDGAWLRVVLPSGRAVCYPSPRLDDGQISYMGTNPYSRKWQRLKTYGGKLVENVTQAAARDILSGNMPRIESAGYDIVLTVHDEIISESPDTSDYSPEHLSSLLSTNPDWALDLPLSAGGFEAYRYRKD
ncbi:hypothetical protein [Xenorhabdus sp. TS4]|uniref:hypothetical protein n=1 Tax=Xenorhabdus sp. TS4 TaxID=1873483 RepID=UPI0016575ECD|nr:hypothetical protein [Xenorhabdus sp. TS4]MBC8950220.1 DNA polymerase I [Xenorhabdus sp. TS4]